SLGCSLLLPGLLRVPHPPVPQLYTLSLHDALPIFEFHSLGAKYRERLFMAGNQLGKTLAGGFECAMHVTGEYPDWWDGRVFDHRSEEHTSELQSRVDLVCRLLLEKKNKSQRSRVQKIRTAAARPQHDAGAHNHDSEDSRRQDGDA